MRGYRWSNNSIAISLIVVVIGMIGLAYAAVPLYQIFCQVTGFGGTTQVAVSAPGVVGDRTIRVRFNADVAGDLSWEFRPVQREITVRIGEENLAFYEASNTSNRALAGTATFNVTPHKAGQYFDKIDCFCFEYQVVGAGERANMPVSFFIDPEILNNPDLDDVKTITLSYTFFETEMDTGSRNSDGLFLQNTPLIARKTEKKGIILGNFGNG